MAKRRMKVKFVGPGIHRTIKDGVRVTLQPGTSFFVNDESEVRGFADKIVFLTGPNAEKVKYNEETGEVETPIVEKEHKLTPVHRGSGRWTVQNEDGRSVIDKLVSKEEAYAISGKTLDT